MVFNKRTTKITTGAVSMSNTLSALILYIAWFLSILLILGLFRSYLTLAGKKAANSFSPTGADV